MAFKMKGHALPGIKQRKAGGYPKKSPLYSHTPSHIVDETNGDDETKDTKLINEPPKRRENPKFERRVDRGLDPDMIEGETDLPPTMEELREEWMKKRSYADPGETSKDKPPVLPKKSPYLAGEVDNSGEVDKNKEAYKQFTSKVITANPQFEEVENPFYDESEGGDKMTKQVIMDWESPAYDDIRDKFAYNPDIDYSKVETK